MSYRYRMLSRAYGLPDHRLPNQVQVILPHCYGMTELGLPQATVATITEAIHLADLFGAYVVFANVDYLGEGMEQKEHQAKLEIFRSHGFPEGRILVSSPCQNSVVEAKNIFARLEVSGIDYKNMIVVHDRPHGRSARKIYNHVFTGREIFRCNVDAEWDGCRHMVALQRSNMRWLAANVARDILLMVKGVEGIGKMSYVSKG